MMNALPTLEDLVHLVEQATLDTDPMEQLTESVMLSGRLTDLGDELVGHFVERARASNATWAEIGERMGVSKQAAQKRFTMRGLRRRGGGFFLTHFTDEARLVARRAVAHAREGGSARVGSEHVLLGLIDDPGSLACRAITGLGGSIEEIRAAAHPVAEPGDGSRGSGHIPFSPDAKKVLELALREAIHRADRRIGTEHILLAILRDGKSPGARLLLEGGRSASARAWITHQAVEGWLELA